MRAVILTTDVSNQHALIHRLSSVVKVEAVVFSENRVKHRRGYWIGSLFRSLQLRIVGAPFLHAWRTVLARYATGYPVVDPSLRVANINDPQVSEMIRRTRPNLVIVSGTNLLGRKLIETCAGSVITNLHTGISPYVRGGPNCTNWCLAEGTFELIGNTVMELDAGVDTGAILCTEQTPLNGLETLDELHWKVMEHAQSLYQRTIAAFAAGGDLLRIPQNEIGTGRSFRNDEWNGFAMRRALHNFRTSYRRVVSDAAGMQQRSAQLRLIAMTRRAAAQ